MFHDLMADDLYFPCEDGNDIKKQSVTGILTIIWREMGKLKRHIPIDCMKDNWGIDLILEYIDTHSTE